MNKLKILFLFLLIFSLNFVLSFVTREDALISLNESNLIIQTMIENNFSVFYMNDTLIQAKIVFEQVDYAEILRGNVNSTANEKMEAGWALRLIDWKNLTYDNVLNYTNEIRLREKKAFDIYDSLKALEMNLENYEEKGIELPESRELLLKSTNAFYEDRYDESEELIIETRESIDSKSSEISIIGDLKRNSINFFKKNWYYIIIVVFILIVITFLLFKKIKNYLLRKKIEKLKIEQKILIDLMKKTQIERFKENKISGLVYNIRMKKYSERVDEIKENLPILEGILKKSQLTSKTKSQR